MFTQLTITLLPSGESTKVFKQIRTAFETNNNDALTQIFNRILGHSFTYHPWLKLKNGVTQNPELQKVLCLQSQNNLIAIEKLRHEELTQFAEQLLDSYELPNRNSRQAFGAVLYYLAALLAEKQKDSLVVAINLYELADIYEGNGTDDVFNDLIKQFNTVLNSEPTVRLQFCQHYFAQQNFKVAHDFIKPLIEIENKISLTDLQYIEAHQLAARCQLRLIFDQYFLDEPDEKINLNTALELFNKAMTQSRLSEQGIITKLVVHELAIVLATALEVETSKSPNEYLQHMLKIANEAIRSLQNYIADNAKALNLAKLDVEKIKAAFDLLAADIEDLAQPKKNAEQNKILIIYNNLKNLFEKFSGHELYDEIKPLSDAYLNLYCSNALSVTLNYSSHMVLDLRLSRQQNNDIAIKNIIEFYEMTEKLSQDDASSKAAWTTYQKSAKTSLDTFQLLVYYAQKPHLAPRIIRCELQLSFVESALKDYQRYTEFAGDDLENLRQIADKARSCAVMHPNPELVLLTQIRQIEDAIEECEEGNSRNISKIGYTNLLAAASADKPPSLAVLYCAKQLASSGFVKFNLQNGKLQRTIFRPEIEEIKKIIDQLINLEKVGSRLTQEKAKDLLLQYAKFLEKNSSSGLLVEKQQFEQQKGKLSYVGQQGMAHYVRGVVNSHTSLKIPLELCEKTEHTVATYHPGDLGPSSGEIVSEPIAEFVKRMLQKILDEKLSVDYQSIEKLCENNMYLPRETKYTGPKNDMYAAQDPRFYGEKTDRIPLDDVTKKIYLTCCANYVLGDCGNFFVNPAMIEKVLSLLNDDDSMIAKMASDVLKNYFMVQMNDPVNREVCSVFFSSVPQREEGEDMDAFSIRAKKFKQLCENFLKDQKTSKGTAEQAQQLYQEISSLLTPQPKQADLTAGSKLLAPDSVLNTAAKSQQTTTIADPENQIKEKLNEFIEKFGSCALLLFKIGQEKSQGKAKQFLCYSLLPPPTVFATKQELIR